MKIPLTRPLIGEEELERVAGVLRSGWLTQGPRVREFEAAVARAAGVGEAVATTSCTTALHLALRVHEIGSGDDVVCPSYTWIATPNAVRMAGARPVFADVDPETMNVTAQTLERALTPKTRALLLVHQFGLPCDLDAAAELARGRGLTLIEDAACALGSRYRGAPIGAHGSTTCFSFHPRKLVTTGEGGALTTGDTALAERCRSLVNHGASVSDLAKHAADSLAALRSEHFAELGYNYRMTDLQGAVGLAQMERLDEVLALRRARAERYSKALSGLPHVHPPEVPEWADPNWQSYVVRIDSDYAKGRDHVASRLLDADIACRPGYMACHTEPVYRDAAAQGSLPATEALLDSALVLPLYPQMTDAEQDFVVDRLATALAE